MRGKNELVVDPATRGTARAAVASTVALHPPPPPPPVTSAAAPVAPQIAGIRRALARIEGCSRRYVAVAHTLGGPPFCIFRGVGAGRGGGGGSGGGDEWREP